MPDILTNGGFSYPLAGSGGFVNASQNMPYYAGPNQIASIPEFQRDYNLGRASITKITEGRPVMMNILFAKLQGKAGWVVDDVKPNYYTKIVPHGRFYLRQKTNQGGTTGSATKKGIFTLEKAEDSKMLQKNDIVAIMCMEVTAARDANSSICDYATATGGSVYYQIKDKAEPLPELAKVLSVDYSTGLVTVERNVGGNGTTQDSLNGIGFTVGANGTTDPGSNTVRAEDAFLVKVANSIAETKDDQLTWALKMTGDYNYVQRVMRKWSANDMEEKVLKRGQGKGNTFQINAADALNDFWNTDMEFTSLLGYRGSGVDESGNYVGNAGGLLETIPPNNTHYLYAPDYQNFGTKPGSFNIPYFNYIMEDKGYYGSQEKFLLCGAKFATAFATMINYMTQHIPNIETKWRVQGKRFESSNGLVINVVVSDRMTLNGLNHMGILWDPATIEYGYLGEDIKIITPPQSNPHVKSGEIFGDITFKRTNYNANHLFIMRPNNNS